MKNKRKENDMESEYTSYSKERKLKKSLVKEDIRFWFNKMLEGEWIFCDWNIFDEDENTSYWYMKNDPSVKGCFTMNYWGVKEGWVVEVSDITRFVEENGNQRRINVIYKDGEFPE